MRLQPRKRDHPQGINVPSRTGQRLFTFLRESAEVLRSSHAHSAGIRKARRDQGAINRWSVEIWADDFFESAPFIMGQPNIHAESDRAAAVPEIEIRLPDYQ